MITMNDTFYSPQQVATKLGVTRQTIYNLIKEGQLEAVKVGNLTKITEGQVNKFLNPELPNPESINPEH